MLEDLLANEIGNALDNPAAQTYPFMTASPDGQEIPLPSVPSPQSLHEGQGLNPRRSFSGHSRPQDSLPLPGAHSGATSRHGSFSGQGENVLPQCSLPGDGITNQLMRNQLPTYEAPSELPDQAQPHLSLDVVEIHQKFLESMKSQDEKEVAIHHPNNCGGGRLEMLLGEMVDEGDGDGVFGGISTMGMIGPAFGSTGTPGGGIGLGSEFGAIGVNDW